MTAPDGVGKSTSFWLRSISDFCRTLHHSIGALGYAPIQLSDVQDKETG